MSTRHKFHAKPTNADGFTRDECRTLGLAWQQVFASKREWSRWAELTLLERAGEISDLERQVSYDLVVNGLKVCRYVADAR